MNSPVQKIKERLSIEEVVSSYIKLERAGSNLKAKCPFHNEKTPSFFVSVDRGTYYCFGCSAKGDIFTFIEEFEGLDFKGALKLLAEKAGVPLSGYNPKKANEKEVLYKIMEEATKFFENNLRENKNALEYLKSRGVKNNTIKDFRIGFVKNNWRDLYNYLQKKGFSDLEMEKAGLIKKTEKGAYDRFRGRIIFPISDSSGRVIAFSGRMFPESDKDNASSQFSMSGAKYLNSPDTPIFNKSSILYGLHKAKEAIRKHNFTILVEGQIDLILSHQSGWRNTVAASGTAFSDSIVSKSAFVDKLKPKDDTVSNLGIIRRLSENIVIAFDDDKAGINATIRAGKIAFSLGMDVKVASMGNGMDPADLIKKEGGKGWSKAIKNSKHLIEFILHKIMDNCNGNIYKVGRRIKEEILPLIKTLPSSIEKVFFLKKISEMADIPLNALEDDLKSIEKTSVKQIYNTDDPEIENKFFRKDYILRKLLGILFWQETLVKTELTINSVLKKIADILSVNIDELLGPFNEKKEELIFEAEVFYTDKSFLKEEVEELLNNLEEESLKEQLVQKMKELNFAEKNKDSVKSSLILKECQIINNKIQNIKNGYKKK